MHGDGLLMFLQPSIHQLAVTSGCRGSRMHFATFHRAHQPFWEPDEQRGIQRPLVKLLPSAPTVAHRDHHRAAEAFGHLLDDRRLPAWRTTHWRIGLVVDPGLVAPVILGSFPFGCCRDLRILMLQTHLRLSGVRFIGLLDGLLRCEPRCLRLQRNFADLI
jgi:hypothetical protein